MSTEKRTVTLRYIPITLVILTMCLVSSAGCIKVVQNAIGGEMTAGNTSSPAVSYPGLPKSRPILTCCRAHSGTIDGYH